MKVEKTTDLKKVLTKLKNVLLNDTRTAIKYENEGVVVQIENLNNMMQKDKIIFLHNSTNNDGLQIAFDRNKTLSINENDADIICSFVDSYVDTKDFSFLNKLIKFVGSVFNEAEIKFKFLRTANISNFDPITQLEEGVYYNYVDEGVNIRSLKLKGKGTHRIASYALESGQPFKNCFVYVPPQTYNGTKCTIIDPVSGTNIDTDSIFKTLLNAM
jgi:hypothetical protein|nr:MAG TPA: hypothetical protein [Caudoviricetes sp.]